MAIARSGFRIVDSTLYASNLSQRLRFLLLILAVMNARGSAQTPAGRTTANLSEVGVAGFSR
jgi:hypothetical protein